MMFSLLVELQCTQGKLLKCKQEKAKHWWLHASRLLKRINRKRGSFGTVNDYLAKRDSAWMAPIFQFHGLSVDCIDYHKPNSQERKNAYNADITYGTNNEFGFDYLRDNMAHTPNDLVQRPHHYAIVDEIDSVLIDDARTPLIISGPIPQGDVMNLWNLNQKSRYCRNSKKIPYWSISRGQKNDCIWRYQRRWFSITSCI